MLVELNEEDLWGLIEVVSESITDLDMPHERLYSKLLYPLKQHVTAKLEIINMTIKQLTLKDIHDELINTKIEQDNSIRALKRIDDMYEPCKG